MKKIPKEGFGMKGRILKRTLCVLVALSFLLPVNMVMAGDTKDEIDLSIEIVGYAPATPKERDIVAITANVVNRGTADAENFSVQFSCNSINHTIGAKNIELLKVNASINISINWIATRGNHTIMATVDPDNVILELDEKNNTDQKRIHVIVDNDNSSSSNDGGNQSFDKGVCYFLEDFDDGEANGWTLSGLWHITNYRCYSSPYSLAYNQESTHDYDTGSANSGNAITPSITLPSSGIIILQFQSWYETEDTGTYWDKKLVYISTDGGSNWIQIYQVSGTNKQWVKIAIDLSNYAGNTIKLKFRFDTVDEIANNFEGWYIDDVVVAADSDGDGVPDPLDMDPITDLKVTVTIKRIKASEYTYTWREGESWDRSETLAESGSLDGPWDIISDPEASNGEYTRQHNRIGVGDWAEWDFTVNKPGVYHIWIRSHRYHNASSNVWPTWNGEDFFIKKWDDVWPDNIPIVHGPAYDICWYQSKDVPDLWRWTWYGAVYMSEGSGTLRIENRNEDSRFPRPGEPEDFMEVDNILITDDPNCVPSGKGIEGSTSHVIGWVTHPGFDPFTYPDFYVKTTIAGITNQSQTWWNDDDVLEDWSATVNVPDDVVEVPITIELWDDDGGNDQLCDIGINGKKCEITYNLRNGTWYGDDHLLDTDFIGRTCGEVDGLDWDYDANVIFEVEQTDYDNDGITYWQETHVYNNSISPEVKNDRYAVIVGAGASCKLRQKSNIGSWDYPYKGTYLRYDRGYGWTDYTLYVDLMTIERFPDGDKEDIGVMFGYQDPDNYYLLRWEENDYGDDRMLLWKFVDGVRTELHDPVYTDLKENQWYTLKIKLVGNYITVDKYKNRPLDGHIYLWERIFNVYDSSLSHGSIALFTWRNRGARFDDILVKKPDGDILLSEGFDYGRIDEWTAVDEASGSSQWELTPLSVDQEDFYIQPDFVYRVLRLVAHYDKNHIVYLSADKYRDADGDGTNDVNGVSMKGSVEYLINDWLDERSDNNDLNLIYIFDHGNYDEVKETSYIAIDSDRDGYAWDSLLNPDSWPIDTNSFIYDYDVEGWLPYYGDGGIGRLTFIVEACYIGHFIDALSHQGQNRIIMPSTTKDASASGDTGSDWPAFSHALFKEMASGDTNFADAFNEADRHVEEENFLSIEIGQDPKLDDNGDKKGSDYPLPDPETKDGYLAAKTGL